MIPMTGPLVGSKPILSIDRGDGRMVDYAADDINNIPIVFEATATTSGALEQGHNEVEPSGAPRTVKKDGASELGNLSEKGQELYELFLNVDKNAHGLKEFSESEDEEDEPDEEGRVEAATDPSGSILSTLDEVGELTENIAVAEEDAVEEEVEMDAVQDQVPSLCNSSVGSESSTEKTDSGNNTG